MRSSTSGCGAGASAPTSHAPSSASSARSKRDCIVAEQGEQRLTGGDLVAGLDVQVDARGVDDRVLGAGAPGAEPPGGDAERQRVHARDDARRRSP